MPFIREKIVLFLLPLFLAAPFINRAYFVDDHYFVLIARWLSHHPAHPYDFQADDAGPGNHGWEKDGFVRMVNPLAHQYILAGFLKLGSDREWFLRGLSVLLSCFSALFLFELARRWTYHPFLSTALVLVTPVFWLTSYSLLIDATLGFFFFGALFFFVRALETDSFSFYLAAGLMAGMAVLTKYPGVFIFPLTGLWWFLRRKKTKRFWPVMVSWGLGLSFLIAYSFWTSNLYGRAHILAASDRMVRAISFGKFFSFFIFLSGSTVVPLIFWWGHRIVRLIFLAFWGLLAYFFSRPVAGFDGGASLLIGLWVATSFLLIVSVPLLLPKWEFPKDIFLFLWLSGFVAMMLVVMDWTAVRYYVLALPAIVFLSVRHVELTLGAKAKNVLLAVFWMVSLLTGSLAVADYMQAEPGRKIGQRLKESGFAGGDRHFYLGDSFTMSYLGQEGWTPCFPQTELRAGDWVLSKDVTMPQIWFFRKKLPLRLLGEWTYSSKLPFRVMDNKTSAGFYASVWGFLPFTVSTGPLERFRLFEVVGYNPETSAGPQK